MTTTIVRDDCRRALRRLPAGSFRAAVTSPPYWMQREYLAADHPDVALEIGREPTPDAYIEALVTVFREVHRVLAADGTLWINLGDKRANDAKWGGSTGGRHARRLHGATGIGRQKVTTGLPPTSLMGMPWRLALALQADRWTLRSDIIWVKTNAFPEGNVELRPHQAHEHVFLLSKHEHHHFDRKVSPTDVWMIPTEPSDSEHVAPMPRALARRCILAGSALGDQVLDPFGGRGTVGAVAAEEGRHATLVELDERSASAARAHTAQTGLLDARPTR